MLEALIDQAWAENDQNRAQMDREVAQMDQTSVEMDQTGAEVDKLGLIHNIVYMTASAEISAWGSIL